MHLSIVSLLLLFFGCVHAQPGARSTQLNGGLVRGDSTQKHISLIFTADEWAEGLPFIRRTLHKAGIPAAFFFTGRSYRNRSYHRIIHQLATEGHLLGPHSDGHLLYCDWTRRDSLLVTKDSFAVDISQNLAAMKALRLPLAQPLYFVPPYEWWNDSIAAWSGEMGLRILSFTSGIRTNADYTYPEMGAAYKSSDWILQWLKESLATQPEKWKGAIVLVHAGTDPRRKDKFYHRLPGVIRLLRKAGFQFKRVDQLEAGSAVLSLSESRR